MMSWKKFWERLAVAFDIGHLIWICLIGIGGAYLLGNVFGMGLEGYLLGFMLGVALALGGFSL